jgi:predicted PurR-regulated permease PerM
MESPESNTHFDAKFVRNMVESALRIGLVFVLLYATYDIIRPFLIPLTWGGIIAIAAFPLVKWLESKLGGRRGLAATLITLVFILLLVLPTFAVTESLISTVKTISTQVEEGNLQVPPPPAKVADLPLIGEKLHAQWSLANENLEAMLVTSADQIKALMSAITSRVAGGLAGVAMFVISLLIAGGFMTYAESAGSSAHAFFVRLGGEKPGGEWATLVVATVRSVLKGVVGVAVIQATLCGIGMFAIGMPGAPIWTALILFLAIAQLPALLVVAPAIVWAFGSVETVPAVIFAVWMLLAGLSDNILKPMLMGRGVDVPMPIILLGAIGGMLALGIIGLFAGAVILSIWYMLFIAWIDQKAQ